MSVDDGVPGPTPSRPASRTRGFSIAGYIAMALGFVSIAFIIRPYLEPTIASWALALAGPAALAFGGYGIARFWHIRLVERFGAILGLVLGSIAVLSLLTSYNTMANTVPATPLLPPPAAASSPLPVGSPNTPEEAQAERLLLSQVAGTAVYLLTTEVDTTGALPQTIPVVNDRLMIGQSGANVALPPGTLVRYDLSADGTSYVLSLASVSGTVVYYDSTIGYLEFQ